MSKARIELKVFRLRQHLTQTQMAQKLGISSSHYSGIEQGTQDPSYKILDRFGKEFEGQVEDVMELFDKQNVSKRN